MGVIRRIGATFACLAMGSSVAAHPGHGQTGGDFSLLHYLIEPQHVLGGSLALLVLLLGAWYSTRILTAKKRQEAGR